MSYFLWLSDTHYDPYYGTNCAFSSGYYGGVFCNDTTDWPFGQHGCDSPAALVKDALDFAREVATQPEFVVVSGDLVRHGVDKLFACDDEEFREGGEGHDDASVIEAAHADFHPKAMEKAAEVAGGLIEMIATAFPETEVILSLGNNDVVPDYYLELPEDGEQDAGGMLGLLHGSLNTTNSTSAKPALDHNDRPTFLRGGYYLREVHGDRVVILCLNTILYSSNFLPQPEHVEDPGSQFDWMEKILASCQKEGKKAILMGHIPPSLGSFRHSQLWKEMYIHKYYEIVSQYDNVVIGQLFGHLHSSEFRIGTAGVDGMIPPLSTPILLGPSITPLHGNNPAFHVVKLGDVPGGDTRLLDIDTYSVVSNDFTKGWAKLHTFSETYKVASSIMEKEGLSGDAFRAILKSMKDTLTLESSFLKRYRSYMLSGAGDDGLGRGMKSECNRSCRIRSLCTMEAATSFGYESCLSAETMSDGGGAMVLGAAAGGVICFFGLVAVILRRRRWQRQECYSAAVSVDEEVMGKDDEDEIT